MYTNIKLSGKQHIYTFPNSNYRIVNAKSSELQLELYEGEEVQQVLAHEKYADLIKAAHDRQAEILAFIRLTFIDEIKEDTTFDLEVMNGEDNTSLLVLDEDGLGDWIQGEKILDNFRFQIDGMEIAAFVDTSQVELVHLAWPKTIDQPGKGFEDALGNKDYNLRSIQFDPSSGEAKVTTVPKPMGNVDAYRQFWIDLKLEEGPMLLFIHGFLGDIEPASRNLFADEVTRNALHAKYGNRIIGFDHPTFSESPPMNAGTLAGYFGPRIFPSEIGKFQLDILTRSRGALVARELLERPPQNVELPFEVQRLVMIGGPNQGTPSARPRNLVRTIKSYFAIKKIHKSLTPGQGISMDQALSLSHAYAYLDSQGPARGLCGGLEAQNSEGGYIKEVSKRNFNHGIPYFTIAAEFNPTPPDHLSGKEKKKRKKLEKWLKRSFKDASNTKNMIPNDGIVPTMGVAGLEHALPHLPKEAFREHLKDSFVLPPAEDVHHENFFESPIIRTKVMEFLTA